MKIGAEIPLVAALFVLSVSMVAAQYIDGSSSVPQPAALGGCYWRATIKEQGANYGKIQCGAFQKSDCNTTVDPCSGYSCRPGPVEGWVKSHQGLHKNQSNPRDCGKHNEAWGAPKRTAPTCGMGKDAAGAVCAVDDAKTACKVTSGTCVFLAGTPYGNAQVGAVHGGGAPDTVRMGVDGCEDMMVGSCWGSDNMPRCVATKDQCQATETYKAWNYMCDGQMVCPGGCKQAQTIPKKPITMYGSCVAAGGTAATRPARCAIDATHCETGEDFVKPYTDGAKVCPCNLVPTGVCKRIANPPKYAVKALGGVRCVTSADSCEVGAPDGYGRPTSAIEEYLPATDAAATAAKCFLCLDFNMDTAIKVWPTQTCTDKFTTYLHPYLPHTHEVQMQFKLPVSKSAFDKVEMTDLFKVAVAGAAGKPGTGSYNTGAISIFVADVYITKSSVASAETVVVDVQIKTYSKAMGDGMKSRMTPEILKMHLAAAGRTCGTGNDGAGEACAVNDALDACKVASGTCVFVSGMLVSDKLPAVEVINSGNVVSFAVSEQPKTPSEATASGPASNVTAATGSARGLRSSSMFTTLLAGLVLMCY